MVPGTLGRPHTVATLALVGFAVVLLVGCRNLFQVCGPALVITPTFDSTSVGGTVTFQAFAEGGGCGLGKAAPSAVGAMWGAEDATIARLGPISGNVVPVTGMRSGETAIEALWQDQTAVAYFQVN
jgi:hypothetical protein